MTCGRWIQALEETRSELRVTRRVAWSNEERALQLVAKFEAERAKVKRLELKLIMARADVLEHRLLKRIRRYRERMGVAVDEEDLRYWLNKRDRAHERIMLINRIALKAEKELANVDR